MREIHTLYTEKRIILRPKTKQEYSVFTAILFFYDLHTKASD